MQRLLSRTRRPRLWAIGAASLRRALATSASTPSAPQAAAPSPAPPLRRRRPLTSVIDPHAYDPLAAHLGLAPSDLQPGRTLDLSKEQLVRLLTTTDTALVDSLYAFAEASTAAHFGDKVYARAIVEFSNVCTKDCFYCGIRKHMKVHRYTMTKDEILACADFAWQQGMGTLMLQSGELPTQARIDFMLDVVRAVRDRTVAFDLAREAQHQQEHPHDPSQPTAPPPKQQCCKSDPLVTSPSDAPSALASSLPKPPPEALAKSAGRGLAVALSLGELPSEVYQAFFDAGAHRYLLRIETSNPQLYTKLHPASHSWQNRYNCLRELQRIGFQVGTGVMVGVPYQTVEDMAGDLLFLRDFGADMVGLGPYVLQTETPIGQAWLVERQHCSKQDLERESEELFDRTTRMYALARLLLGDVNIAATTALQVLNPSGREIALQRGANVVMPIITPTRHRGDYLIYESKPCVDEDSVKCTGCLDLRVKLAGKELLLDGGWHDPPHYLTRLAERKRQQQKGSKS